MPKLPKLSKKLLPVFEPEAASFNLDELVAGLSKMANAAYQLATSLREWRDKVEREQIRLNPDQDDIPF